jgi:hypothetical protein
MGWLLPIAANAASRDVFAMRAALRGNIQDGNQFVSQNLTTRRLVNAAMGRPLDVPLPAGQVLALVHECQKDEATIVVFDRLAQKVVANVGKLKARLEVHSSLAQQMIVEIELQDVGNLKHVEKLMGVGTVTLSAEGCTARLVASAVGALELQEQNGQKMMLIPRGKFSTGRRLAALP